jgi:hypothetical protein
MSEVMVEIRNFRAHQTLGAPSPFSPAVPVPNAGDVVEIDEHPYVCLHRSFEYGPAGLVRVFVMVEPDEG